MAASLHTHLCDQEELILSALQSAPYGGFRVPLGALPEEEAKVIASQNPLLFLLPTEEGITHVSAHITDKDDLYSLIDSLSPPSPGRSLSCLQFHKN